MVGYLRARGVEAEPLGLPALPYLLAPLHGLHPGLRAALAPRARAPAWDAVVVDELCHPSVAGLAAARARARRRRPPADPRPHLVTLVHHLRCREDRPWPARALARARERRLLAASDAVIVNSQTTARTVRELLRRAGDAGARPIAVCPPGCDELDLRPDAPPPAAPLHRPSPAEPVRLLATGNLIPRKGYDLLLAMLAGLTDLPWELRVAGRAVAPAYRRRLESLACRLGLAGRVAFLGELDPAGLAEEYRGADMFVFASRYEGYGISLAEAVRAGLPFVAFEAGAVAEVVGGRGLLAAPGDRTAFAGHLRRLIAKPAFRLQAAALSRELAAGLPTWEDTGRGFLKALREAVGEGAGRG
jgi:glycosyltransferase involved in cell wall biosynthesis